MLKHSKQRDAIEQFLATRYDHPTAETVYLKSAGRLSKDQPGNCLPQSVVACRIR